MKDLNHPLYRAFVLSDCIGEGILSEEQVNRRLAVTVVQTRDGVLHYNDTYGGKQLKVYGAPFLFEQFFKGKASETTTVTKKLIEKDEFLDIWSEYHYIH